MEKFTCRKVILFILQILLIFAVGQALGENSTAYISIEVKNTKKVYQEIQKISIGKKIIPSKFSEYANDKTKKKSISISYVIPKEIVVDVMANVASLGNVKSQSFNDKSIIKGNIQVKTKMLDYYKGQLDRMIATQTAMPEAVSKLNYMIESMEEEIIEYEKQGQDGYEPKVELNIQIKEYGYEGDSKGLTMSLNIIYFVVILLAVFAMAFIIGFMTGWLFLKKKSKPIPVNA